MPLTVLMNTQSNSFLSIDKYGIVYNKLLDIPHEGDDKNKSLVQLNNIAKEKIYQVEFIFDSDLYDLIHPYRFFKNWITEKFYENHTAFFYYKNNFQVAINYILKIINSDKYNYTFKEVYFYTIKKLLKKKEQNNLTKY